MSVATKTIFDVFLSHGAHDTGVAGLVKTALRNAGLEVFPVQEIKPTKPFMKEMRRTLAECSAMVMILTRSTLNSQNTAFEVGAAMAWNKPIYILHDGITPDEIPGFLRDFQVRPVSQVSSVADEIVRSQHPLSDEDRESLVQVYQDVRIPTDQLLLKPLVLEELSRRYNKLTDTRLGGERLIQELIRLRKQGKLPRVNHN